jgi:hypothetical protein
LKGLQGRSRDPRHKPATRARKQRLAWGGKSTWDSGSGVMACSRAHTHTHTHNTHTHTHNTHTHTTHTTHTHNTQHTQHTHTTHNTHTQHTTHTHTTHTHGEARVSGRPSRVRAAATKSPPAALLFPLPLRSAAGGGAGAGGGGPAAAWGRGGRRWRGTHAPTPWF